jgi:hypothetical protein
VVVVEEVLVELVVTEAVLLTVSPHQYHLHQTPVYTVQVAHLDIMLVAVVVVPLVLYGQLVYVFTQVQEQQMNKHKYKKYRIIHGIY